MLDEIRFKAEMNAAHTTGYKSVYQSDDNNIEVTEVDGVDWDSTLTGRDVVMFNREGF
jgi:hypothetical protein